MQGVNFQASDMDPNMMIPDACLEQVDAQIQLSNLFPNLPLWSLNNDLVAQNDLNMMQPEADIKQDKVLLLSEYARIN